MLGKDVIFCYDSIFALTSKSRPTLDLNPGFIIFWGTKKGMRWEGRRNLTSVNVNISNIFERFNLCSSILL